MSAKANVSLIGVFVLGGAVLLLSFVVLFGNVKLFTNTVPFVLYFDTSVSGLNEGAPVLFRGVKVGRVSNVRLEANPESLAVNIPVTIEIDPARIEQIGYSSDPKELFALLIERGLRAKLAVQSLITGQCYIELDFHPKSPLDLFKTTSTPPEIPTVRSGLQELSATVERLPIEDVINKLLSALEGIEKTVHSPKLQESIASLNQTLQIIQTRIGPTMDNLDNTLRSLQHAAHTAANSILGIENRAGATLSRTGSILSRTEADLDQVMQEIARAAQSAQAAFVQIQDTFSLEHGAAAELAGSLTATLNQMQQAMKQARATLESLAEVGGPDSAISYELTKTLRDVSSAARSLKTLTDTLERRPEAFFRGKSR